MSFALAGTPVGRAEQSIVRFMNPITAAACITLATLTSAAQRQGSPSNSLPRALAAFAAADVDRDGKISPEEARRIPISAEDFAKEDGEDDGSWSRDEFMLPYHRRLVAGAQPVGSDLHAEVARIQALKRVRVVEQVRMEAGDSLGTAPGVEPVATRLEKALGALEKSAVAKKATAEDFRRLRNLVILSGRSASKSPGESRTPTAQARMLQTLARIEERAASGQYVREDFERLRMYAAPSTTSGEMAKNGFEESPRRLSRSSMPSKIETPPVGTRAGSSLIPDRTGPIQGPADARRRAADPRGSPPAPAPVERAVVPPDKKRDSSPARP